MQDPQMTQYGNSLMGFKGRDDEPAQPGPNRAQRRAMAKKAASAKRRGQRAYAKAMRLQAALDELENPS